MLFVILIVNGKIWSVFFFGFSMGTYFLGRTEEMISGVFTFHITQDRLFLQTAMNELSSHHFQFAANFSSDIVFGSDIYSIMMSQQATHESKVQHKVDRRR